MNSYWMFWIGHVRGARSELARRTVYLRFSKNYLSWLNHIFLLFAARKSCVFQIYLCANIIKFDSVDFSGHHPEEVISFFWRSVYMCSCATSIPLVPLKNYNQYFGTNYKSNSLFSKMTSHTGLWNYKSFSTSQWRSHLIWFSSHEEIGLIF